MAIIDFTIQVASPEDISAIFDRIQVWRSQTELGTFVDITANDPTSAVVDGVVEGPWAVSGQSLTIILDGAEPRTLTFTGSNPLPLQSVLAQINERFPDLASEVPTDTGCLRLASSLTGTPSIIEITGSATATLGLSTARVNGKAPRPILSATTFEYPFRDFDGQGTYWYRTRYYNSVTGAVSTFSSSQQGDPSTSLPGSNLSVGKIALADSSGQPIVGRRIILVPVGSRIVADGVGNNYGILPSVDRLTVVTDSAGRAQITLVRGQTMKIFIEGTTFQRQFTVPNTDFDLLTVASSQPDPFSIVVTPPMPIRMS